MEFVYVVPRAQLFPECYPQGLVTFGAGISRSEFEARLAHHGFYVERARAEREPAWKQIIPYAVVVRTRAEREVLLMKRLRKGGEGRLFDKLSIGVGGHLNPCDQPQAGGLPLDPGTRREIEEELEIDGPCAITSVGILNDDANPVGAVHLGLVQVVTLDGDARIRERDVLEGTFTSPVELRRLLHAGANFETWSKALAERLDELLDAAAAASRALPARPSAGVQPIASDVLPHAGSSSSPAPLQRATAQR
jgi:predicted NUDIX family phosphoesterase